MARSPHSLPGAHVLAWSSPLLLLVLLFTVTSRATTPATHSTTTAPAVTTTSTPARAPTTTTTARPSADPATTVPRSSAATASNGRSSAPAQSVSVGSGALAGALSPALAEVVVPLRGPGAWSLTGSTTLRASISCPSVSGPVVGTVTVAGDQECQLTITARDVVARPTWQLTPLP